MTFRIAPKRPPFVAVCDACGERLQFCGAVRRIMAAEVWEHDECCERPKGRLVPEPLTDSVD